MLTGKAECIMGNVVSVLLATKKVEIAGQQCLINENNKVDWETCLNKRKILAIFSLMTLREKHFILQWKPNI